MRLVSNREAAFCNEQSTRTDTTSSSVMRSLTYANGSSRSMSWSVETDPHRGALLVCVRTTFRLACAFPGIPIAFFACKTPPTRISTAALASFRLPKSDVSAHAMPSTSRSGPGETVRVGWPSLSKGRA
eukprot:scaffold25_cov342-Pavlova_lutheri.AAC.14